MRGGELGHDGQKPDDVAVRARVHGDDGDGGILHERRDVELAVVGLVGPGDERSTRWGRGGEVSERGA